MSGADAAKAIKALGDALMTKGLQTGHLSIMSVAPGEATSAVAPRQQDGSQQILMLLNNQEYLRDLGRLAALDVYTLQTDRVLSGNLGNWMTNVAGGRVSALIDNTDRLGNVNYFLGNMNPNQDNLSALSNGKVTTVSSEAQAKNGALDTAIWNIFRGIYRESAGAFTSIAKAFDWVKNPSSQDLSKTNYWYFYGHMETGWDQAVARLKTRVTSPLWKKNINERITKGGEPSVPAFLIERLKLRNRYFLGVTTT
jgi:hypothetical protein